MRHTKRILMTGAGGYLGLNLTRRLAGTCPLRCLVRTRETFLSILNEAGVHDEARGAVEIIQGDVLNPTTLREAFQGVDTVVHLAGVTSDSHPNHYTLLQVNVLGVWTVLQAAAEAGVSRVIIPSTYHVYGRLRDLAPGPVRESTPLNPVSVYATSKALAESLAEHSPVATVILRFSHLIGVGVGRGDWGGILLKMIDDALTASMITLDEGAGDVRDYLHVNDAVECLRAAALNPTPMDGTYNVGRGQSVTLQEMAEGIATAVTRIRGHEVDVHLPATIAVPAAERAHVDISSIGRACGFSPTQSPDQTIEELIERLVPVR